jgi:hypothetical protein
MTPQQATQFKNALTAAESTGLQPRSFASSLHQYLLPARAASEYGYSVAFIVVSVVCLVALILMIRLIRKPPPVSGLAVQASADSDAQADRQADPASRRGNQEITGGRDQRPV